jgi:hypothetical protein
MEWSADRRSAALFKRGYTVVVPWLLIPVIQHSSDKVLRAIMSLYQQRERREPNSREPNKVKVMIGTSRLITLAYKILRQFTLYTCSLIHY